MLHIHATPQGLAYLVADPAFHQFLAEASALDDRQTTVIAKEPVPLEGAYVSIHTETPSDQQLLGVAATLGRALVIWRHSHTVIDHPVWSQALFADGC